jgi:hypothetical protein
VSVEESAIICENGMRTLGIYGLDVSECNVGDLVSIEFQEGFALLVRVCFKTSANNHEMPNSQMVALGMAWGILPSWNDLIGLLLPFPQTKIFSLHTCAVHSNESNFLSFPKCECKKK